MSTLRVTDAAGDEHDVVIVEDEAGPRIDNADRVSALPHDWHELITMGEQLCVVVHQGEGKRVYPVGAKVPTPWRR